MDGTDVIDSIFTELEKRIDGRGHLPDDFKEKLDVIVEMGKETGDPSVMDDYLNRIVEFACSTGYFDTAADYAANAGRMDLVAKVVDELTDLDKLRPDFLIAIDIAKRLKFNDKVLELEKKKKESRFTAGYIRHNVASTGHEMYLVKEKIYARSFEHATEKALKLALSHESFSVDCIGVLLRTSPDVGQGWTELKLYDQSLARKFIDTYLKS